MATVEQEVPPLAAGDRMTRDEFLRYWEMHPEIKRAELIGGIVYMPSPVTIEHGDWENDIGTWLGVYRINTPGTASGNNATAFLLKDAPQPDVNLRVLPECGGISRIKGKYLAGATELLTEVCRSSAAYDLHQKYDLYEAAGVQEYLALLVYEQEIRWHVLVKGRYELQPPDADGIWRSRVFPGLWLDGTALLRRDMQRVLAVLQSGLASPEHETFVKQLAENRAGK
jgi:putative restriction endonuclease